MDKEPCFIFEPTFVDALKPELKALYYSVDEQLTQD